MGERCGIDKRERRERRKESGYLVRCKVGAWCIRLLSLISPPGRNGRVTPSDNEQNDPHNQQEQARFSLFFFFFYYYKTPQSPLE